MYSQTHFAHLFPVLTSLTLQPMPTKHGNGRPSDDWVFEWLAATCGSMKRAACRMVLSAFGARQWECTCLGPERLRTGGKSTENTPISIQIRRLCNSVPESYPTIPIVTECVYLGQDSFSCEVCDRMVGSSAQRCPNSSAGSSDSLPMCSQFTLPLTATVARGVGCLSPCFPIRLASSPPLLSSRTAADRTTPKIFLIERRRRFCRTYPDRDSMQATQDVT